MTKEDYAAQFLVSVRRERAAREAVVEIGSWEWELRMAGEWGGCHAYFTHTHTHIHATYHHLTHTPTHCVTTLHAQFLRTLNAIAQRWKVVSPVVVGTDSSECIVRSAHLEHGLVLDGIGWYGMVIEG